MTDDAIAKIFVSEVVARHSAPKKLLSDKGANFRSELTHENFLTCHLDKILSASILMRIL